jgi:hypothetical protein
MTSHGVEASIVRLPGPSARQTFVETTFKILRIQSNFVMACWGIAPTARPVAEIISFQRNIHREL